MKYFVIFAIFATGCNASQRDELARCQARATALNAQYSIEMSLRCREWLKAGKYSECPDYNEIEERYSRLYSEEADKC